jgi:hypothetical protein
LFQFQKKTIVQNIALGIVADSPEAGEPASLPRTMSGKPDGELASRNAQKNKKLIQNSYFSNFFQHDTTKKCKFAPVKKANKHDKKIPGKITSINL